MQLNAAWIELPGEKLNEFNGYIKRIDPSITAVSHIMWAEMQYVQPPWDRWILINLKHQVLRKMGGYKIGFTSQSSKPHHIDQKLAKNKVNPTMSLSLQVHSRSVLQ